MKLFISSLSLFVFLGMVAFSASAKKSERAEYCEYISDLMLESAHKQKNLQNVDELVNVTAEVHEPLTKEAIAKNLDFQGLKALAKTRNITVTDFFELSYLREYRKSLSCGKITKTEAGIDLGNTGRPIMLDQTSPGHKTETDLSNNPYFKRMQQKKGKR
jgi:hypothetical protein